LNIAKSGLASSPLGKAFFQAKEQGFATADFAPYAPSNGEPAGFMCARMLSDSDFRDF